MPVLGVAHDAEVAVSARQGVSADDHAQQHYGKAAEKIGRQVLLMKAAVFTHVHELPAQSNLMSTDCGIVTSAIQNGTQHIKHKQNNMV